MAERLGISVLDLCDSTVMRRLREELDIGVITAVPGAAKGLEAKARIAELLDIEVNSVELDEAPAWERRSRRGKGRPRRRWRRRPLMRQKGGIDGDAETTDGAGSSTS